MTMESGRANTRDCSVVVPGVVYPVLQFGVRSVLQRLLREKVSSGSLDYAGVLVLLLEVITSAPQFSVLTMWVVARAFISSPLMPSTNPVFSQDRRDAAVHRLGSF